MVIFILPGLNLSHIFAKDYSHSSPSPIATTTPNGKSSMEIFKEKHGNRWIKRCVFCFKQILIMPKLQICLAKKIKGTRLLENYQIKKQLKPNLQMQDQKKLWINQVVQKIKKSKGIRVRLWTISERESLAKYLYC